MQRIVQLTKDGSHTVAIPDMDVTYHSRHGAIQESMHVFIDAGLDFVRKDGQNIGVLEMGFGTGLNALLAMRYAREKNITIQYTTLEKFPVEEAIWSQLNFTDDPSLSDYKDAFAALHLASWGEPTTIIENFIITKLTTSLVELKEESIAHPVQVIFFDAFAPSAQPELWTSQVFQSLASILQPDGILVTYCSKGDVRRAMMAAGLRVEKIPGPPGKREMVRAHRYSKL